MLWPSVFRSFKIIRSPFPISIDDNYYGTIVDIILGALSSDRYRHNRINTNNNNNNIIDTTPPSSVAYSRQRISQRRGPPRPPLKISTTPVVRPYVPAAIKDVYSDYRDPEMDFHAEPVEIPISGKVRIHSDGYIECLDMGNFPHPFSCKKFISCAKMESDSLLGWEYTCPRGLSFDPIGGICNWSAGLGCKE